MARIFVTGWGDARQIASGYVGEIVDFASAEWSVKGFVSQGRLAAVYDRLTVGDVLLVRYGPHDMEAADAARCARPGAEFEGYLERFVNVARNKGATPVFLAPALPGGETWLESCRSLAQRLGAAFVQVGGEG